MLVGWIVGGPGIPYVFAAFSLVALAGGVVTLLFATEARGRVLEELSP
jgi:putative MFS transporter